MAYGRVEETIWSDQRVRGMPEDARWLFLYLLTCPHRNRLGCFVLDPYYAAGDLQWDADRVKQALRDLQEAGRILYDPEVRVVLIRSFLKHNVLINPNVVKGARNDLGTIPDTPLLDVLRDELERHKHRSKAEYGKLFQSLETRCETRDLNESDNDSDNDLAIYHTHTHTLTGTHNHTPTSTDNNPHTPRAKSEKSSETEPLTDWLGEHAHVLDGTPLDTPRARRAFFGQFVAGLRSGVWKHPDTGESVPEADRPRLLAAALSGYFGTEGKRKLITAEFAGMLRRVIRDEQPPTPNGLSPPGTRLTDEQWEESIEIRRKLVGEGWDQAEAAAEAERRVQTS